MRFPFSSLRLGKDGQEFEINSLDTRPAPCFSKISDVKINSALRINDQGSAAVHHSTTKAKSGRMKETGCISFLS